MTVAEDIQYRTEYLLLRAFATALHALPPNAAVTLGNRIGMASRVLMRRRVRLADENLDLAFGAALPAGAREELLRGLLGLLGEALVESLLLSRGGAGRTVSVEGWEHIEKAMSAGRGIIIVPPHLGMWELAGFELGQRLSLCATVYRPMRNPYVDRFLLRTRERTGMDLLSSRNGLRKVLGYLRKGGAVVMLLDQNAGRAGVPATFFGRTASTHAAPALFALRTGCAVVPGYILRAPGCRCHRMVFHEAFPLLQTGNMQKDIVANTQQYNDYIEGVVRAHPEQWFGWIHRRWKQPRWFNSAEANASADQVVAATAADLAAQAGLTVGLPEHADLAAPAADDEDWDELPAAATGEPQGTA